VGWVDVVVLCCTIEGLKWDTTCVIFTCAIFIR
jgi:hypothetical protein